MAVCVVYESGKGKWRKLQEDVCEYSILDYLDVWRGEFDLYRQAETGSYRAVQLFHQSRFLNL
jgi:hypothetical protein